MNKTKDIKEIEIILAMPGYESDFDEDDVKVVYEFGSSKIGKTYDINNDQDEPFMSDDFRKKLKEYIDTNEDLNKEDTNSLDYVMIKFLESDYPDNYTKYLCCNAVKVNNQIFYQI